jgi:glyoxylase-like metal-dependent hydrolase (beta-lactamase superfamily II)
MSLTVLRTGTMRSRAAFAFQGGAFGDTREFAAAAILLRHPRGNLLFDAGFGRHVQQHIRQAVPWLMRAVTRYRFETPIGLALAKAGIDVSDRSQLAGVVLTHGHWDHVSGLLDLPGVPVWLTADELRAVRGGDRSMTLLARALDRGVRTQVYGFDGGPFLGFPRSRDVFGDGSVVLVPSPGHTPGSVIAFLSLPGGRRVALVGDLAWQREGIERPAERPWMARRLADHDAGAVRQLLRQMHQLARVFPGLLVVPAHDERALAALSAR